jgi:hypothetical protein
VQSLLSIIPVKNWLNNILHLIIRQFTKILQRLKGSML